MEKFKKFAAIYAIIAGICIPVLWIFILAAGVIIKLNSEPTALTLLLASEFITAVFLLTGGIGLLLKKAWSLKIWFLSMGMLLYAVLNATGQFMQMNHPFFAPAFIIITAATACTILLSLLVNE